MPIVKPTRDLFGNYTLDMRVSPKQGRELRDEIIESVMHTQKFIQMTVPDKLIVTQRQFASLNNYTEKMYNTEDRMFNAGGFVLEVQIDREVDNIAPVEETMQIVDNLKKLDEEGKDE